MRTLAEVQQHFPGTTDTGLSPEAAAQSRKQFGANKLTPLPREPLWKKFLEKFDEPIIKILLAAALLSMFVDLFQGNATAAGISFGIVVAAVIGVFVARKQEWLPSLMLVSAVFLFIVSL